MLFRNICLQKSPWGGWGVGGSTGARGLTEIDVEQILSTIKSALPMIGTDVLDLLHVQLINSKKKKKDQGLMGCKV